MHTLAHGSAKAHFNSDLLGDVIFSDGKVEVSVPGELVVALANYNHEGESEKTTLRDVFHANGWSDQDIATLCKGDTLSQLHRRMFPTPVLDKLLDDVFSLEEMDRLGLSGGVRISICFMNAHIETLRELVVMSERRVLDIPNMGKKSLAAIKEVLAQYGLHLGMQLD